MKSTPSDQRFTPDLVPKRRHLRIEKTLPVSQALAGLKRVFTGLLLRQAFGAAYNTVNVENDITWLDTSAPGSVDS